MWIKFQENDSVRLFISLNPCSNGMWIKLGMFSALFITIKS